MVSFYRFQFFKTCFWVSYYLKKKKKPCCEEISMNINANHCIEHWTSVKDAYTLPQMICYKSCCHLISRFRTQPNVTSTKCNCYHLDCRCVWVPVSDVLETCYNNLHNFMFFIISLSLSKSISFPPFTSSKLYSDLFHFLSVSLSVFRGCGRHVLILAHHHLNRFPDENRACLCLCALAVFISFLIASVKAYTKHM